MSSFYQFYACLRHIWSTLYIIRLLWSAFLCRGLMANWSKEAFSSKTSNPPCSKCRSQMTSKSLWDALGVTHYMLYYCVAHERNRTTCFNQQSKVHPLGYHSSPRRQQWNWNSHPQMAKRWIVQLQYWILKGRPFVKSMVQNLETIRIWWKKTAPFDLSGHSFSHKLNL